MTMGILHSLICVTNDHGILHSLICFSNDREYVTLNTLVSSMTTDILQFK
jgi:hypothetical protein